MFHWMSCGPLRTASLAAYLCIVLTSNLKGQDSSCSLVVSSVADSGPGSLRAAIECANSTPGHDTITFAIPGDGPHVIQLTRQLPDLTEPVVVDGYTQPGSRPNTRTTADTDAIIKVEIRGTPAINMAFFVRGGNTIVQGIAFNSFRHTSMWIASNDNIIRGNFIGTDASGLVARPNGHTGILLNDFKRNTIGGRTADARNLISGNVGAGICLKSELPSRSSDNFILGNVIGLSATGSPLPNDEGIQLDEADNTQVGGLESGEANYIAGNRQAGVVVYGSGTATIVGNSIYGNGGLAIDLVPSGGSPFGDGLTVNDSGDRDSGPNGLQNYPAISSAVTRGSITTIEGSISTGPNQTVDIDLYANEECHVSGHGEGKRFLKRVRATTSVTGIATFETTISPSLPEGTVITATATSSTGGTSEFSSCRTVITDPVVQAGDLAIGVIAAPEPVQIGTPLKYTISVTNLGPGLISNVRLEDLLPAGVTNVIIKTDHGDCTIVNGLVTCNLGTLTNGEIAKIEIIVTPTQPGILINSPKVTGTTAGQEITKTATTSTTVIDAPVITVEDVTVTESAGAVARFQFRLSSPSLVPVVFKVRTSDGTAVAGSDYDGLGLTEVRFEAGQTNVTISVPVRDDGTFEGAEDFQLLLSDVTGARLSRSSAKATIEDNDLMPSISVNDITVSEGVGAVAEFEVTLSGPAAGPVTVHVVTQDGTATAGSDFQAVDAVASFAPGETRKVVRVPVVNDTVNEAREKFYLALDQPAGGLLGKFLGIADIVDDDAPSTVATLGIGVVASPDPVTVGTPVTYTIGLTNLGPGSIDSAKLVSLLPGGLTNVVIQTDRGVCTFRDLKMECDFGTLTNGEVVRIVVKGNPSTPGSLTNQFTATAVSNGQPIQASAEVVVTAIESVVLTVDDVTVVEGPNSFANFRLKLSRASTESISVTIRSVTETAIGGEDYVPLLTQVTFPPGSTEQTVSVRIIDDSVAESTEFFRLNLTDPVQVVLDRDKVYGYITDNDVVPAKLALGMEANPNPVVVGQPLTYTLLLTNLGPGSVDGVKLTDSLPAGLSNVMIRTDRGICTLTNGFMSCDFGTLTNGEVVRIEIVGTPTLPGEIVNRATASGISQGTPVSISAETTTTVLPGSNAGLGAGLKDSADPAKVGDPLTYSLSVTNTGNVTLTNVVVVETLPPGVTFVSANSSKGTCTHAAGVVRCVVGDLAPGEVFSLDVVVTPQTPGTFTNLVKITGEYNGTQLTQELSESTVVEPKPPLTADLGVKLNAPPESIDGEPLAYSVTITNAGPSSVSQFFVTNTLPPGTKLVSATPKGTTGSCFTTNDLIVICVLDGLPAGGSASVDYVVDPAGPGVLPISVDVAPGGGVVDPNLANNKAGGSVTVNPAVQVADLGVKLNAPSESIDGQPLSYSATITNAGPAAVGPLYVTNTLAPGTTLISAVPRGTTGSCFVTNLVTVICTLDSLPPGGTVSVDYTILPSGPGQLRHQIAVAPGGSVTDPNLDNNQTSALTLVREQQNPEVLTDIAVGVSAPLAVSYGRNIPITATITNLGPDTATQVIVTNVIPENVDFVSATPSGATGSCEFTNGLVICTLGAMAPGQVATIEYLVNPTISIEFAWRVSALATGTTDRNLGNNEALATTLVSDGAGPTDLDDIKVYFSNRMKVNRQTGLFEQSMVVTNTGTTPKSRLLVKFSNLPEGAEVYNAAGFLTNNGVITPYMLISGTLAPNQSTHFLVEYHKIPRGFPVDDITVTADFINNNVVLPDLPDPSATGVRVDVTRAIRVGTVQNVDRSFFLVEFPTTAGRTYAVQYSEDGGTTWRTSAPLVVPPSNRYQWIDDGPPKTVSLPSETPTRVYRVFQLP